MRPRVFPAEDLEFDIQAPLVAVAASMRPRVFPAEDSGCQDSDDDDDWLQ